MGMGGELFGGLLVCLTLIYRHSCFPKYYKYLKDGRLQELTEHCKLLKNLSW